MIFVDSNVPMYLVGAPHPHKADAQRALERCQSRQVGDSQGLRHNGDPQAPCRPASSRALSGCLRDVHFDRLSLGLGFFA